MQDSKDTAWGREYDESTDEVAEEAHSAAKTGKESEPDGWQQYRRWISKAPAPRGRRTGVDPSLYTWKGYRNWSEQVKRNWQDS
jgi:hypothetical protein